MEFHCHNLAIDSMQRASLALLQQHIFAKAAHFRSAATRGGSPLQLLLDLVTSTRAGMAMAEAGVRREGMDLVAMAHTGFYPSFAILPAPFPSQTCSSYRAGPGPRRCFAQWESYREVNKTNKGKNTWHGRRLEREGRIAGNMSFPTCSVRPCSCKTRLRYSSWDNVSFLQTLLQTV